MEEILAYFELTEAQKTRFKALEALYEYWNAQINVISRKDLAFFYTRHVLHALAIAKCIAFKPATKVIDIGTGGGFPGIPLAIFFPEVEFHLVDSIGKKIKVVNEVATTLALTNVKAFHARVEEMPTTYEFAVTRAVAPMKELLRWIKPKISNSQKNALPNGILALKGGDLTAEFKEAFIKPTVYNIADFFNDPFFETKKVVYYPI